MKVYIILREDGQYYGSYEVYKVVGSENKAKNILKNYPKYTYGEYIVE